MAVEGLGEGLEHHALADGDLAELGELVWRKRPGVGVGEKAGLGAHESAALGQVVDRRGEAVLAEPCGRVG